MSRAWEVPIRLYLSLQPSSSLSRVPSALTEPLPPPIPERHYYNSCNCINPQLTVAHLASFVVPVGTSISPPGHLVLIFPSLCRILRRN